MSVSYAANAAQSFYPDPQENIMQGLFQQYERVLVESLITSFGFICALYADNVNLLRTSSRLRIRPAPCGAEQFQSKLPRPVPKITPSWALIGMIMRSFFMAEIVPFRSRGASKKFIVRLSVAI